MNWSAAPTLKTVITEYGTVRSGPPEALFAELARLGVETWRAAEPARFSWALTGGSTPRAWYRWCVERRALPEELRAQAHWFVGDERRVPLASDESNFGTAARLFLEPLGVSEERRHPWPVAAAPTDAVARFGAICEAVCGEGRGFTLCLLGLGEDAHTASLFPGSPLLSAPPREAFAALDVPNKGWRFTLTPAGLARCEHLVVHATGAAKREAVRRVFEGNEAVAAVPAKLLRAAATRTTWLLDTEAVADCPRLR